MGKKQQSKFGDDPVLEQYSPYEDVFTPVKPSWNDLKPDFAPNSTRDVVDRIREITQHNPHEVTEEDIEEAIRRAAARRGVVNHESVLAEADRLVSNDRNADYGHPLDDFGKVVGMAKALWGRGPETEEEHAIYMIFVKLAREANRPQRDNRVDGPGYFKTLDMVIEERARRNGD